MKIVQEKGFLYKLAPESMIIIPGGMATASIVPGKEDLNGLRWALMGPQVRKDESAKAFHESVTMYPEQAAGRLGRVLAFLTSD